MALQESHTLSWIYTPYPLLGSKDNSLDHLTSLVFVRDPPRGEFFNTVEPRNLLVRSPSYFDFQQDSPPRRQKSTVLRKKKRMAKKRRSLQAILIPSFLQSPLTSPTSTTGPGPERSRSNSTANSNARTPPADSDFVQPLPPITSPRNSPPPSFLLDDDPFADLTTSPFEVVHRVAPTQTGLSSGSVDVASPQPRYPLTGGSPERTSAPTPSSPPSAVSRSHSRVASKSVSFARMQPVPACQKPAFGPKPSQPSLDTLSRINVVLPKKVRKGRVGAGLPFEPWDNLDKSAAKPSRLPPRPSTSPSLPSGFVSELRDPDTSIEAILFEPIADVSDTTPEADLTKQPPSPTKGSIVTEKLRASLNKTDLASINESVSATPDEVASTSDQTNHGVDVIEPLDQSLSHDNSDSELPYITDTDSPSLPALSPSNDYPSLTRSISTSSSGSDDYNFGAPANRYGNGLTLPATAERETDFSSPPDSYFSILAGYGSSAVISNWQSDPDFEIVDPPTPSVYPNILDDPDLMHQPGSSTGTLQSSMFSETRHIGQRIYDGELLDGADHDSYRGGSSRNYYPTQSSSDAFRSYSHGWSGTRRPTRASGSGDGDGDDDRSNRRPSRTSALSATSSSEITSDEGEESADERDAHRTKHSTNSTSDDDVPLAQSIPTALVAQKSIRKQVREERDQRRKERSEQAARAGARSRQTTLRPAGAGNPLPHGALSSSQEAAHHAVRVTTRPRTQTLPGRASPPFVPEDLARKLQDVSVRQGLTAPNLAVRMSADADTRGAFRRSDGESPIVPKPTRTLHHSRSLHQLQNRGREDHRSVPLPANAEQKLERARSARSRSHVREETPSFEDALRVPVPRISIDQRKIAKPFMEPKSARPSIDGERRPRPSADERPPVPVPVVHADMPVRQLTHQRVFIGDMQRYNVVEIDDETSAGEVIRMLDAQGSLKGWVGSGDWMVWEIAHDFRMERPIRHFERLSDVQASWNKDKMVNTFVVRLTTLAPLLSRSAIPSSSPTYAGYVEWESKRGKWSKRWLQLREHSLWISKRDNGKDQTLLCSLSNFDAYHINRLYKAPKPFVFAVKSTDKLSFFEDASDYLHVISCSEKEGKNWMEKILVARSYVLHQERNVLFNPKSYGGTPSVAPKTPSRSGTHKWPAQPLVSVANHKIFEPGSLLHRQG